jgi:hypothetical protein
VSVASSLALPVREDGVEEVFPFPLDDCSSVILAVDKGGDSRLIGLIQCQKWPVGFGLSLETIVWDQGNDLWDGEDGDFPYPLGVFPLPCPWIGLGVVIRMFVLWWGFRVRGLRIRLWRS